MTKISEERYDCIIYGATFTGIVCSIMMKQKGVKVLLINHYGFPGGSLTESLNCYQEFEPSELSPITFRIYDRIAKERNAIIPFGGNGFYLNPEITKQILLFEAVESGVDLLFHTKAKSIVENKEKDSTIELLAKEGLINFRSREIIDCSDDKYLSAISGGNELFAVKFRYNFIVNDKKNNLDQYGLGLRKMLDIGHGRKWVSCEMTADSNLFIEQKVQGLIDYYSGKLQECGAGIQILPAQAELLMKGIQYSSNDGSGITDIETVNKKQYKSEEIFLKASDTEKRIW